MGGTGASPGPGGEFGDLRKSRSLLLHLAFDLSLGPLPPLDGFSGLSNDQEHRENHSFCLDQNRSQIPTNGGLLREGCFPVGPWEAQWRRGAGAGSGGGCGLPDSPFTKW